MTRRDRATGGDHERARELAAAQIDELLPPGDAAWLAGHLEACPACAAVAAEYDAQHGLLFALRDVAIEPPRDLWARTSAAISAERPRGRGLRWRPLRRSPRRSSPFAFAPAIAAVAIIAVVGAGLLSGGRILPGGVTPTPIAIDAADLQVLALDAAGNLRLLSRSVDQVCPTGVTDCGPAPTFSVSAVSSFGTVTNLYGAMSPTGGQVVVVSGGPGNHGVYVVPVKAPTATPKASGSAAQPGTSSAVSPTASHATATPTAAPDSSSTSRPTEHPSPPTASPAVTPSPTPGESSQAPSSAPPTDGSSSSPSGPSPTPSTPASPSPTASDAGPTASAGTSEPPSAPVTSPPAATDTASIAPSGQDTPAPMTAIRIATDVTVVGAPVYSPDGTQLAFSATPSSGGAGADIFVWTVGDGPARAITTDHGSWLAGWTSQGILVSRVDNGIPATFTLDPATSQATPVGPQGAWLPSLSPSGTTAAWWSGTVKLAADGVTWLPDQGQLVLGAWPGSTPSAPGSSGTPASAIATAPQVLATGPLDGWQVRWDETGSAMAVWVASAGAGANGQLTLYSVDPATGSPNFSSPMLDTTPANPDFSLRAGRLAWTTPSADGGQTVTVVAWSGSTVYPPMTVVADGKGTVIP